MYLRFSTALIVASLTLWPAIAHAEEDEDDPVWAGSVWKSERKIKDGPTVEFELRITRRAGTKFEATQIASEKNANDVEGTFENGNIEWKIKKVRFGLNPGQPHSGFVRDKKMFLTFEGKGISGAPTSGESELTLQPEKSKKQTK